VTWELFQRFLFSSPDILLLKSWKKTPTPPLGNSPSTHLQHRHGHIQLLKLSSLIKCWWFAQGKSPNQVQVRILQAGVENTSTFNIRYIRTRQEWTNIRAEERGGSICNWQVLANACTERIHPGRFLCTLWAQCFIDRLLVRGRQGRLQISFPVQDADSSNKPLGCLRAEWVSVPTCHTVPRRVG